MTTYNVRPSDDQSHIVLTIVGEVRGKHMKKYIVEAHAVGKEMGIHRYLVDVTEAKNIDSVTDQYKFAYSDMKNTEGVDPRAKVAALVSPGDKSHDFIETLLHNAGLLLKIFTHSDMAMKYLEEKSPNKAL